MDIFRLSDMVKSLERVTDLAGSCGIDAQYSLADHVVEQLVDAFLFKWVKAIIVMQQSLQKGRRIFYLHVVAVWLMILSGGWVGEDGKSVAFAKMRLGGCLRARLHEPAEEQEEEADGQTQFRIADWRWNQLGKEHPKLGKVSMSDDDEPNDQDDNNGGGPGNDSDDDRDGSNHNK